MANNNKSGIYKIVNIANKNCYIGSAAIFRKRFDLHRLYLRNNKHFNKHLQAAWNSAEAFDFKILEIVSDKSKLIEREQFWLDWDKPQYNICKIAESRLGLKSSPDHVAKIAAANKGKKRSKESCIKIGLAKKGTKISEERKQARRDFRHSEETKLKIASRRGWKHSTEAKEKMCKVKFIAIETTPIMMIGY